MASRSSTATVPLNKDQFLLIVVPFIVLYSRGYAQGTPGVPKLLNGMTHKWLPFSSRKLKLLASSSQEINCLLAWLVEGAPNLTVISVVGKGGLGKTTLAKTTFDNQKVGDHFNCCAWITVSQSYTIQGLLRSTMKEFCKATKDPLPSSFDSGDEKSMMTDIKDYLQQKRYVICFDDVWEVDLWDKIKFALPDNKKGSRILVTTRIMDVAEFCREFSLVHVHELEPLSLNKAWQLFCKKTFRHDCEGQCPEELKDISKKIVQKCGELPLAIVVISGLLSTKLKKFSEWEKLHENLSYELGSNPRLIGLKRILALSYDDLPYYLKSCFLYFGIYPEDCSISCVRLTRQWIAEGFVKCEKGNKNTFEEVAEEYLMALVRRSLVQVSEFNIDGKARKCRVHDMLREMIIRKMEELSFCRFVDEANQSTFDGIARRVAIATDSHTVLWGNENSCFRSMYIFKEVKLPESFVGKISVEFKLLKVLDFEDAHGLHYVPDNLGNLFHLRYLSLRKTQVKTLPKSIGMLQNLETLDLKETLVHEIPRQISKLTKLRHLLAYHRNIEVSVSSERGVQMKGDIGCLIYLQKLFHVDMGHGGIDLIRELGRPYQRIGNVEAVKEVRLKECKERIWKGPLDEMKQLETLDLTATSEHEIIDLQFISSPPPLRKLHLKGRLEKLPQWVPNLHYLQKLWITYSTLTDDPLHFQEGGFQKLKELTLGGLTELNSISIDKGALPVLEKLEIVDNPLLKEVPSGIQHLRNLTYLISVDLPNEFNQSIEPDLHGQEYWIIKHVRFVWICHNRGPRNDGYNSRLIQHSEPS